MKILNAFGVRGVLAGNDDCKLISSESSRK